MSDEESAKVPSGLAGALYADLKAWMVSVAAGVNRVYDAAVRRNFASPAELLHALGAGDLKDGQAVRVDCKVAPVGPFLSTHFLMPIVGSHTSMRLGPPLITKNPIMGMLAQTTSHLMPVGLYPSIAAGIEQVTLYPPNSTACGFIGILPGVEAVVPTLTALVSTEFGASHYRPVQLTGRVRAIDALDLAEAGIVPEEFEGLRQAGRVWFLDATDGEAQVSELHVENGIDELWGGLYASGHLEIESGSLEVVPAEYGATIPPRYRYGPAETIRTPPSQGASGG